MAHPCEGVRLPDEARTEQTKGNSVSNHSAACRCSAVVGVARLWNTPFFIIALSRAAVGALPGAPRCAGGRRAGGGAAGRPGSPCARCRLLPSRPASTCPVRSSSHGPGCATGWWIYSAPTMHAHKKGHGQGLCRSGRDRARRRDRRSPSPAPMSAATFIYDPLPLSVAAGEEAGRPGPGGAAARMGSSIRPSIRCAVSSRRASGPRGKREYIQVPAPAGDFRNAR